MKRRLAMIIAALTLILPSLPGMAQASYAIVSKEEMILCAKVIFIGTVTGVESIAWNEIDGKTMRCFQEVHFAFRVEEVIQGDLIKSEPLLKTKMHLYRLMQSQGRDVLVVPGKKLLVLGINAGNGELWLEPDGFQEVVNDSIPAYNMTLETYRVYVQKILKRQ